MRWVLIFSLWACSGSSGKNDSAETNAEADTDADTDADADADADTDTDTDADADTDTEPSRVYATLVSHNEQDNNPGCAPVLADRIEFLKNRRSTLDFAEMVVRTGAAWDLQTDFRYLEQLAEWEDAAELAETDGKTLFKYLTDTYPDQIVVDPHNHDTPGINYADVAAMLEAIGVPDTGVVGGFLYYPAEDADWQRFEQPLDALSHPGFSWQGQILWGPATSGHSGPDSEASGLWRPTSAEDFHTDDPTQSLVAIGMYKEAKFEEGDGAGLVELLDDLEAGAFEPGAVITASLFYDQCGFDDAGISDTETFIDSLSDHVDAGRLVWATVPDVVETWRTTYESNPWVHNAP